MQKLRLRHYKNSTFAKYTTSEEALLELQKFIDYISSRDLTSKIFFHEVDGSLYPKASVWINVIRRLTIPAYHCHDYYELNFVLKGKCIEIINDTPCVLTEGCLLVLPPHSAFHTLYLEEGSMAINIILKAELFESLANELAEGKDSSVLMPNMRLSSPSVFSVFNCESSPEVIQYIDRLMDIYVNRKTNVEKNIPPKKSELIYAEKLTEALLSMLQVGVENKKITVDYSEPTTDYVSPDEVIYYIKNNYATVSTAELSRRFGYSERQLYRMIQRVTGNTFQLLVMLERINHAKELLKDTSLSVDEISGIVGLKSRSYFCNMFKKQTDMTPLEYRAKMSKKN